MHEYPITQRIIEVACEHAKKNEIDKIKQINLVVGDYSGYVASSIELYFDIIAEGTACADSKLNIVRIKPKLKCDSCGEIFERALYSFECPLCNGQGSPTEIGHEFFIKSIEV